MRHNHLITPDGTSDLLYSECASRRACEKAICKLFARSSYSEVRTPELEFYDVFCLATDPIPPEAMYKLTDSKGRLLVLRPDNTLPIARMVATKLRSAAMPLRLYYNQPRYRISESMRGGSDQVRQAGVELIGAGGLRADLEILTLALKALSTSVEDFRFELGCAAIFDTLTAELDADEQKKESLRRFIEAKNYAALSAELDDITPSSVTTALRQLPRLFGGVEVLKKAAALIDNDELKAQLYYLARIYGALSEMGFGDKLMIDLGLVHKNDYYSGIVFSAYTQGSGESILSGGRYDGLMKQFGFDCPACGFAVNIDALVKAVAPDRGSIARIPDVLVIAEQGRETEALRYISSLHDQGLTAEFCVLDTVADARQYASQRHISRLDVVSDRIETFALDSTPSKL